MAPKGKGKSTTKNPVNALLKQAKSTWGDAKQVHEDKFGDNKIAEGKYEAKMIEAELGVIAEKLVVKIKWEIVSGDYKGRSVYEKTLWLHTSGSQAWFINWLDRLDVELEDIEDTQEVLDELVKEQVGAVIKVVNQEDSQYVNAELIKGSDVVEEDDDEEDDEDDDESVDLDEMSKKELKQFIKDEELDIKVTKKMSEDDIREAIEEAMGGEDEADDEEEDDSEDLESMSKKELKALIKEEGLKIKGVSKMDEEELIEAIEEARGESEEDDDEEDDEDDDESVDLDEMSKKELKQFIKDEELDIKVTKKMSEDDIREAIEEAMGEADADDEEDDEDDSEDLESMSKKELKALIKEEGLKIKGVSKMDEEELIEAIEEARGESEEDDDEEDDEDESGDDSFELTSEAFDEFCENQDLKPKKKDKKDEKAMTDFIATYEYVEDELEDSDKELLNGLGLGELIVED